MNTGAKFLTEVLNIRCTAEEKAFVIEEIRRNFELMIGIGSQTLALSPDFGRFRNTDLPECKEGA